MGSNIDLRKLQSSEAIEDAFSKLVSGGKAGYKTVLDKNTEPEKCQSCSKILEGNENFCPECEKEISKKIISEENKS